MASVEVGDFGSPDETRTPEKTTVEIVRMGGVAASRMRLEPGWRWSECIKPVVGGERCQAHHVGLLQSGTMHVVHEDGTEQEIRAGQSYVIEPGHDALGRRRRAGGRVRVRLTDRRGVRQRLTRATVHAPIDGKAVD